MVKQLMKDDLECIRLIGDVVREKVSLPVARPAGWHDRSWIKYASGDGVPKQLQAHHRTHSQAIKDFCHKLLHKIRKAPAPPQDG